MTHCEQLSFNLEPPFSAWTFIPVLQLAMRKAENDLESFHSRDSAVEGHLLTGQMKQSFGRVNLYFAAVRSS